MGLARASSAQSWSSPPARLGFSSALMDHAVSSPLDLSFSLMASLTPTSPLLSSAAECFKVSFLSSSSTDPQSGLSSAVSNSSGNLGSISIAPASVNPPTLTLAPGLPNPVLIPLGWPYTRCTSGQVPTASQPCETGALATDSVDGPAIQSRILMCPSSGCNASGGCSGDRVIDKQPSACGIDSVNNEIGTTLTLDFVIFNTAGLSSKVTRVLQIVSPCNSTQFYCNGVCSNVGCLVQAAIDVSSANETSNLSSGLTPGLPTLVLLPSRTFDLSTPWEQSGRNKTVFLEWGIAAPYSLAPCSSWAAANLTSTPSCAAAAYDTEDGDISSFIEVKDIWTDQLSTCTVSSITLGTCLPGQHVLQYEVSSSTFGLLTRAYLIVFIEERASVNFSFSFIPPDSQSPASASLLSSQLTRNASIAYSTAYK